jgi:predicted hydrolase (HD superfamily)
MTVPGRVEAASLLLSLDPSSRFLRHACAVAEVAGFLAARAAARGRPVDRRLVEAAALLHDVDKILPADDPARALPHAIGSAAWLAGRGHPELSPAVAAHTVGRLIDGDAFRRWMATAPLEERIVAYADKRATKRLRSMDSRFARWRRKHGPWAGDADADVRTRAAELEADVCGAAGVDPGAVRRLRWTERALGAARQQAGG